MMSSGSMASFRAAAPPEMFGEPDDDAPEQPRCHKCGAFLAWGPTFESPREESYFGNITVYAESACKRCGTVAWSTGEVVVGKVYGPLPPWSDPYMVWNAALGVWEDYMAQDYRDAEAEGWFQ